MPPFTRDILSYLIIRLRESQSVKIHVCNQHSLLMAHLAYWPDEWQYHARETQEGLRRTGSIAKDYCAGVIETSRCESRFEIEGIRVWIHGVNLGSDVAS
jgi:hypothetical protein